MTLGWYESKHVDNFSAMKGDEDNKILGSWNVVLSLNILAHYVLSNTSPVPDPSITWPYIQVGKGNMNSGSYAIKNTK